MFRLYVDEDAQARALVAALRREGFDCVTVNEAGMRGSADSDQLQLATDLERVLYTANVRDFRPLHERWLVVGSHHSGIVVLTEQLVSVGVQVRALRSLSERVADEDMRDRLEFLLNWAS